MDYESLVQNKRFFRVSGKSLTLGWKGQLARQQPALHGAFQYATSPQAAMW